MGTRIIVFAALILLGCSVGNEVRFAVGSGLVLEKGQRDLGSGLEAKAELVRSQLLPTSLQGAILNRAIVDVSQRPCVAICMNMSDARGDIIGRMRTDTSIAILREWEFPHTTDVQAVRYRWRDRMMHSYLFLEPGSGLLMILTSSGEEFDEPWFRRCVRLPNG